MSTSFFVMSNLLAIVAAWGLASRLMRDRERWLRALAAVAGFPVLVTAVLLLLGLAGLLTPLWATVAMGLLAAVAGLAWWRRPTSEGEAARDLSGPTSDPADRLGFWIAVALLTAFGLQAALRTAVFGGVLGEDQLSYHATAPAHWLVDGRLSLAPFSYPAYYPLSSELFSLWFMLPFHGDALASLSGFYWLALAVVSAVALALALGAGSGAAALAGALLLASPDILLHARMLGAVDVSGPALVLASLTFALQARRAPTPRAALADAAYCGALSGLAAGCKLSLAPVPIVLLLWLALGMRRTVPASERARRAVVFAAAALLAGGFWYARNLVLTGNPLFPAAFGPLTGPFSRAAQSRTRLLSWLVDAPTDLGQWRFILKGYTDWPIGLFLLSTMGYLAALWAFVRPKSQEARAERAPLVLVAVIGLMLAASFPCMPFSGTYDGPSVDLRIHRRYVIPSFALGLVLFSSLTCGRGRSRAVWFAVAVLAVLGACRLMAPPVEIVLAAMALLVGLYSLQASPRARAFALRFAWVLLPVGLAALAAAAPRARQIQEQRLFSLGAWKGQPIGEAWRAVAALPKGSRIAWFGPATYQYYAVFGRDLELVPVLVNADGSPGDPLHIRWRRDPEHTAWWPTGGHVDLTRLVDNLLESRIDYVLVTKWDGDAWPQQQQALAASGKAEAVYDDGYSTVWKLPGH